jgi:hypothetical protein
VSIQVGTTSSLKPEDFETAVAIMQTRGWCQNTGVDERGRVCAAQALSMAAAQRGDSIVNLAAAAEALGLPPTDLFEPAPVVGWNDDPATTWPQVEQRFLAAAWQMRAQAQSPKFV